MLAFFWCLCVLLSAEKVAYADDTAVIITSEEGDPIAGGQQLTLTAPEMEITVGNFYGDGTTVTVRPDQRFSFIQWQITIRLPWSGSLKRGIFPVSSTDSSWSAPRFSVRSPKGSFSALDGSFEIKKSTYSEAGLASLWFTFDVRVPGSSGAFRGEVRFHADSTEPGINRTPGAVTLIAQPPQLDTPTSLEAHLVDDDLPVGGVLTSVWEILGSGANYCEIADPAATLTTVTFHEPGNYKLQLHVSDGEKSSNPIESIVVPVPVTWNLLHAAGSPKLIHHDQSELLNTHPSWNVYLDSMGGMYNADEFAIYAGSDIRRIFTLWRGQKRLLPGVYGPVTDPGDSQTPRLSFGDWGAVSNAHKFEVRAGSRPGNDTLAPAAWITFSIYGSDDEPIALGEMRYNIVPSTVLNAPPIIDAGMDREFTRTSIHRLHGAAMAIVGASDAPLTTAWSMTSGPGEATFADPAAPETDVTFSAPGRYLLRLTASQGAASVWDEVAITVYSGETSLIVRDLSKSVYDSAHYLTEGEYDFRVTEFTGNTLKVACDKRHPSAQWPDNEHWRLTFQAPEGEQLGLKRYVDDSIYHPTQATLSVGHDDPGPSFDGEFSITELNLDDKGKIASLRINFIGYGLDQKANRVELPLRGELRLRADVSHDPANLPPRVSAGSPQYLSGRSATILAGVFDDDLLPAGKPLTWYWQVVSGPGSARINDSKPNTVAEFTEPGSYVLRYTISDGEYSASDDVTIVVGSAAETYRGYVSADRAIAGTFQVRLLSSERFTGSVVIGESRLPLRGRFTDGYWSWSVPLRDGSKLSVSLHRSPSDGAITGSLHFSSTTLTLVATQSSGTFLHATHEASPFAAAYTWITELPTANDGPHGYSFGTAKVSRNGAARFTGRLSDGRAISYGGSVGLDGWVPLFWTIPHVEQFGGPIQLYNAADGVHLRGSVPWMRRPAPKAARFPDGFQFVAKLIGARYTPPASGMNFLTQTEESVKLTAFSFAPSWPGARKDELTLRTNNSFIQGNGFTLQINPRSGLFRGTLIDAQRKTRSFSGAFLQPVHAGGGSFVSNGEVGAVYIKAN